ncbi:MAG: hypothetical protein ABSG68_14320 [Thermoguttaceae bacterium]
MLLQRMKELIQAQRDFGFETTLAGKTYRPIFEDMKGRRYALHLFYLWLPSVDLAVARVTHRVQQGGHNVPEPAIRRRYDLGLRNLFDFYLPLFDSWILFDNSTPEPRTIARYEGNESEMVDAALFGRITQLARGENH